jgi:hypothetical protein
LAIGTKCYILPSISQHTPKPPPDEETGNLKILLRLALAAQNGQTASYRESQLLRRDLQDIGNSITIRYFPSAMGQCSRAVLTAFFLVSSDDPDLQHFCGATLGATIDLIVRWSQGGTLSL